MYKYIQVILLFSLYLFQANKTPSTPDKSKEQFSANSRSIYSDFIPKSASAHSTVKTKMMNRSYEELTTTKGNAPVQNALKAASGPTCNFNNGKDSHNKNVITGNEITFKSVRKRIADKLTNPLSEDSDIILSNSLGKKVILQIEKDDAVKYASRISCPVKRQKIICQKGEQTNSSTVCIPNKEVLEQKRFVKILPKFPSTSSNMRAAIRPGVPSTSTWPFPTPSTSKHL